MPADLSLIDTGVFLEVLLGQERKELCRSALEERQDRLMLTDFALHAIGLILLRNKRRDLYIEFVKDVAPRLEVLSLPVERYFTLLDYHERFQLDFDDAYQLAVSNMFELAVVTLDSDFLRAKNEAKIILIR